MSKSILQFFSKITKKKKLIWIILVVSFVSAWIGFASFIFLDHGTPGILRWVDYLRAFFTSLFVLGAVFAIIISFDLYRSYKRDVAEKYPSKAIWALILIGTILPISLLSYVGLNMGVRQSSTPIQLVMLDGTGANSIPNFAVLFYTNAPSQFTLKYGTSPSNLNLEYKEPSATRYHALLMKDLLPSTKYYYSIDNGNTVYNFTTFSSQNRTLRFGFTSDGHFGKEASNHTATKLIFDQIVNSSNNFDALFLGGDLVELGFRDAEWIEALEFLSPYTTRIPFRNVAGNHDTFFGGVKLYKDYFYNINAPLATGSQLYYHIVVNDIHLFFLNLEWDTGTFTKAQREWFENELKKLSPSDLILVFSHSFYYSSGIFIDGSSWVDIPDMISEVTPLFEQYGVDMVFSGHNHHFEYLEKNGVRYHIAGAMGGVMDPVSTGVSVASVWRHYGNHGFIDVAITPSNITVNYRTPEFLSLYNYTITL